MIKKKRTFISSFHILLYTKFTMKFSVDTQYVDLQPAFISRKYFTYRKRNIPKARKLNEQIWK